MPTHLELTNIRVSFPTYSGYMMENIQDQSYGAVHSQIELQIHHI